MQCMSVLLVGYMKNSEGIRLKISNSSSMHKGCIQTGLIDSIITATAVLYMNLET